MAGPQFATLGNMQMQSLPGPGSANAPGAPPPPMQHLPTGNDGMSGGGFSGGPMGPLGGVGLGNINPGVASPQAPPQQRGFSPMMQQRVSQLHPNTMNALRSIPPEALQQLHGAGLIHPGLMQHLRGGGAEGGGGRGGPMTGSSL